MRNEVVLFRADDPRAVNQSLTEAEIAGNELLLSRERSEWERFKAQAGDKPDVSLIDIAFGRANVLDDKYVFGISPQSPYASNSHWIGEFKKLADEIRAWAKSRSSK